jgi:hypothetical protein
MKNNLGDTGRTQSDHHHGTWNNGQQQQNGPNAYFQQNGTADRISHGVSKLSSRSLVQAVAADASLAPTTILYLTTPSSCKM